MKIFLFKSPRAASTHLNIREKDFWVIIDVVSGEELGNSAQQIHFWHAKQIG